MTKKSEHELKNPESWDFDHLEVREPVKSPRVVVSVAFPRESFNTISQCAELLGKKTSEFIREAALEKTKTRGLEMKVYDYGSTGSLWFDILPSNTRLYTIVKEQEIHETIATS